MSSTTEFISTEFISNVVSRCAAESYGAKCCGQLTAHNVIYNYPLYPGRVAEPSTISVPLCVSHYDQITAVPENNNSLPELYGYCSDDLLDGLFAGLADAEVEAEVVKEKKAEEICRCSSFNNNELHTAILTYLNGFEWRMPNYTCAACVPSHPSCISEFDTYLASLTSRIAIAEMVKNNPKLTMERNAYNTTPIELMSLISSELVMCTYRKNPYVMSFENEFACINIEFLKQIRRDIMEVMKPYMASENEYACVKNEFIKQFQSEMMEAMDF